VATRTIADDQFRPEQPVFLTTGYFLNGTAYKYNLSNDERPTTRVLQGTHSILASHQVSEEALRQYLVSKNSPLVDYTGSLLTSPFWSTIIGICTIEEYSCSVNPYGSNNLWGIMRGGHLERFESIEMGIQAINDFLEKAETSGRTTIESFKGWYCQSECTNWESTVIQTKEKVENLKPAQ